MILCIDTYQNHYANNCSDVVKSRKRKLKEVYQITQSEDAIPNISFATLDAPTTTPEEAKFLEISDILQYVSYSVKSAFEVVIFAAHYGI